LPLFLCSLFPTLYSFLFTVITIIKSIKYGNYHKYGLKISGNYRYVKHQIG
jgi:hypothetical protein